jgi:hypothetical protein
VKKDNRIGNSGNRFCKTLLERVNLHFKNVRNMISYNSVENFRNKNNYGH